MEGITKSSRAMSAFKPQQQSHHSRTWFILQQEMRNTCFGRVTLTFGTPNASWKESLLAFDCGFNRIKLGNFIWPDGHLPYLTVPKPGQPPNQSDHPLPARKRCWAPD